MLFSSPQPTFLCDHIINCVGVTATSLKAAGLAAGKIGTTHRHGLLIVSVAACRLQCTTAVATTTIDECNNHSDTILKNKNKNCSPPPPPSPPFFALAASRAKRGASDNVDRIELDEIRPHNQLDSNGGGDGYLEVGSSQSGSHTGPIILNPALQPSVVEEEAVKATRVWLRWRIPVRGRPFL